MSTQTVTFTRTGYVIRISTRHSRRRVLRLHGWTCDGQPRMSRTEAIRYARRNRLTPTFTDTSEVMQP